MKFKILKNIVIIASLLIQVQAYAVSTGNLPNPTDPFLGGDSMSLGACAAQGNVDFIEFLNALTFSDGFIEGSWQPFVDLVYRNNCQSGDISNLRQQRDKIRSQIRAAFLSCENQKVASLKKAHLKVTIEIYYVRHMLNDIKTSGFPVEFLADELKVNPEKFFKQPKPLFDEIGEKYFDESVMSTLEFNSFYQQLTVKYQERRKSYVLCESSSFKEVEIRWNKFMDNIAGIKPAAEQFADGVGGAAEKLVNAVDSMTDTSIQSFLEGNIALRINGLEPRKALDEISGAISSSLPSFTTISHEMLLSGYTANSEEYDLDKLKKEYQGKFDSLYRDTGGDGLEILITSLRDFKNSLTNSVELMQNLKKCLTNVNNKQCVTTQ